MISALIFVISVAALAQFGLFAWRAAFFSIAAKELSPETREALGAAGASFESGDLAGATKWLALSPNLSGEDRRLWTVKSYYAALRAISAISRILTPSSDWSHREMIACARYAAVVVEERLQRNRLAVAAMQSY